MTSDNKAAGILFAFYMYLRTALLGVLFIHLYSLYRKVLLVIEYSFDLVYISCGTTYYGYKKEFSVEREREIKQSTGKQRKDN